MILLDTNVLSELARAMPEPTVFAWAQAIPVSELCTTAITEAELHFGLALLPPGARRTALTQAIEAVFARVVQDRVLLFDRAAAPIYGDLAAKRRRLGRSVNIADLQIQAIARAHSVAAIATRNTVDFSDCGLPLINPWQRP
ncbi:MAG TPA: type II toxin-antitoxin system VapC family toxin [Acetobacteraceae bacterium]|nr:type II toxin-antitoxin system VapC family toxin [Acetobacteraceae bacterium]